MQETELTQKVPVTDNRILSILMFIIIFVSMGQSVYWQSMPIIGRQFDFSEIEINSLISISAAMFILFTPYWGKLSDRIGRKAVLIIGLSGYVLSTIIFISFVTYGLLAYVSGITLLMLLLLSRIINSALGAASRPATGAYVADITTDEDRSSGMGKFGAANNIGTIAGPVLVGSFIGVNLFPINIESFGLLTPLILMAGIMTLTIIFAFFLLPTSPVSESSNSLKLEMTLDSSLKILIGIGVIIFTCFAIIQSVTAYYLQDRFSLNINETARSTALCLGAMAAMAIVSQLTIVQRFKGPPLRLILWSIPIFIISSLTISFSLNFNWVLVGMGMVGLAMGLASPGYSSFASLNADSDNQGAAVGLAMIAPGVGFALGPLMSGFLYQVNITLPFLFIIPLLIAALILIFNLQRKAI